MACSGVLRDLSNSAVSSSAEVVVSSVEAGFESVGLSPKVGCKLANVLSSYASSKSVALSAELEVAGICFVSPWAVTSDSSLSLVI